MRGDQPVVSAASWIVRASIGRQRTKTLTRPCQGSGSGTDVRDPGAAGRVRIPAVGPRACLEAVVEGPGDLVEAVAIAEPARAVRAHRFDGHPRALPAHPRPDRVDDDRNAAPARAPEQ